MSSGFVPAADGSGTSDAKDVTNDAWERAKADIEATKRRKEDEGRQSGGQSLYEVLQQNKAAKQDAFEESIRLKNQFRSLDEDEVEFLDSVLESTREKEQAVKKETLEQLEVFRKQQEDADKALLNESAPPVEGQAAAPDVEDVQWTVGHKKRKKTAEKEVLKGVKLRRVSSTANETVKDTERSSATNSAKSPVQAEESASSILAAKASPEVRSIRESQSKKSVHPATVPVAETQKSTSPVKSLLGLDYGSDDDDD
ncbi:MAG: hypothetical protein M1817_001716 [Caeruleum heppii]|nr:MAG: hypothetical protein M1817_001716 [Caeruleum heppii]